MGLEEGASSWSGGLGAGVTSISLHKASQEEEMFYGERRRGRAEPLLTLSRCGACSVLRERRNSSVAAQLTHSALPCLKRGRNLNPWVTSKQLGED